MQNQLSESLELRREMVWQRIQRMTAMTHARVGSKLIQLEVSVSSKRLESPKSQAVGNTKWLLPQNLSKEFEQ